jgi:hypothetical protein
MNHENTNSLERRSACIVCALAGDAIERKVSDGKQQGGVCLRLLENEVLLLHDGGKDGGTLRLWNAGRTAAQTGSE